MHYVQVYFKLIVHQQSPYIFIFLFIVSFVHMQTSPLFVSCINGHVRIVKRLLEDGADVRVDKLFEDDEGRWSIRGNCLVLSTLLGQEYVK